MPYQLIQLVGFSFRAFLGSPAIEQIKSQEK
jgi:hypothetical protein